MFERTLTRDNLHVVAEIGGLTLATQPNDQVQPGQQNILISIDGHGDGGPMLLAHDLACALGAMAVYDHAVEIDGRPWLVIPHSAAVDARLVQLVNLAAALRYSAPGLVQLTLDLSRSGPWMPSR